VKSKLWNYKVERKYALLLSFLITGLIASNVYLFTLSTENTKETIIVARVIDGDTLVTQDGKTIRLTNINSPEKNFYGYDLSSNYLKQFENQTLQLEKLQLDKYSRILGKLYIPKSQEYINLKIVQEGLASKFLVEDEELKQFAKAEAQAINQEKGIWKKSSHYGCFTSQIDKKSEVLILTNNCPEINLKSWILKDESRKNYKFQDIAITSINLHSKNGKNNSTNIFWNSKTNIWNNDRDTLYLFDENGNIVHHNSYGY